MDDLTLQDEKQQKARRAVSYVRNFMERSAEYRKPHLELAQKSRNLYHNWITTPEGVRRRRANLKPGYGFTVIETLVPQIVDIFSDDQNWIKFQGRDAFDAQYENSLSDFFDYQFSQMDLEAKLPSIVRSMSLDGTVVCKVPYRFEERKVIRRFKTIDPRTGAQVTAKEEVPEVTYDGPDLQQIPLVDFFPDWQVRRPADILAMRGCVHRTFKTLAELKKHPKYKNLSQLELSMNKKGCNAWKSPYYDNWNERDSMDSLSDNEVGIKDRGKIEVWEYWGHFDATGNGDYEEYLLVIANGDVVLRMEENFYDYKFKPFVASVNYARDNEFYGVPELAPVESEIREGTAIRNARLDQINLSVNRMFVVERGAGIDAKNVYSRPGGLIFSNDVNGIKPLDIGDPSPSSSNELQQIERNINTTTAISASPAFGAGQSFARSATGVSFIQSFTSSRLSLKTRNLSAMLFKPMVWVMMMTNRQFIQEDQAFRVLSPDAENPFAVLPPDSFFMKYDWEPLTKRDLSDEQNIQKLQAASGVLQTIEATQPGSVKFDVIGEALLRPLVGSSTQRFMRNEQEMQAYQEEQAVLRVQEQQANAQIGRDAPQPNASPSQVGGNS